MLRKCTSTTDARSREPRTSTAGAPSVQNAVLSRAALRIQILSHYNLL